MVALKPAKIDFIGNIVIEDNLMTSMQLDIGFGTMPVKVENDRVLLIDQRFLPEKTEYFDATEFDAMCEAIKVMVVRGAPSIGVAAAYGLAYEADRLARDSKSRAEFFKRLDESRKVLEATRPTAVNLIWATQHINKMAEQIFDQENSEEAALKSVGEKLKKFAFDIMEEHVRVNKTLSDFGAQVIEKNANVLTHCNAGSLAACGWGTALGVIRSAHLNGTGVKVFVDETRPRNQGAKLTMWELTQDGIPATLVCDSMSGHLMSHKKVDVIITGADRIARNGDTANKIGTYNLAVLAHYHGVPFYIAAPLSTFDPNLDSGEGIPIEHRDENEITAPDGICVTVSGARAYNPAFDVTPAKLIAGIITEAGILRPDYRDSITKALLTLKTKQS